ncbi:MAG: GntR family transcriptional regulator [Sporichthyaceae bacterium]
MKYRRIADDLRSGIRSGEYEPGQTLPGENDLMARYKVARMTVRQALAELQREGLAVARRGSGVYVSDARPIVRDELGWLAGLPWARGEGVWTGADDRELRVEELDVARIPAPDHVTAALRLAAGTCAWARSRRYVLDRREVMLSVSWLPADAATPPALAEDPGPGGVYARLAEAGWAPTRFREDVRARLATPQEAQRLTLSAGAAVLTVERVAYAGDRPVEVVELLLDAAVYVLRYDAVVGVQLSRTPGR